MIQNCKKNIFIYNKDSELTTYIDLEDSGEILNYYNLKNKILTKFNTFKYEEKNKRHSDIKKAKITYAENCMLHHMFLDGESRVVVVKPGSFTLESPVVISRIYSHNNESIEGYTLNSSLIENWLKKL